ncbi:putative pumilio/PUF RNA binding protein 5 [Trypanosoma grayi]|uniref:putative pumilio/PUF RNA binding protein 5 n=1 Tax=Trypanosoma grayi TaxID=71804 RepID=UPI0004F45691|nr:putative pumilio/PUF RNA binding protein 5 [Trypanosoma grayi]KEG05781.1 putative pumilio/PUF RNA binding protein 5 [Trypanosoma grayi]
MVMAASGDPNGLVAPSGAHLQQPHAPPQVGPWHTATDINCSSTTHGSTVTVSRSRRYTHNPYTSPLTTPSGSSTNTSRQMNTSTNTSCDSSLQSYNPCAVREPGSAEAFAVASSLMEQFLGVVGKIPHTACTVAGRHLLVSVLRLQHMDKMQIIIDELVPQLNVVALDPQGCHVVRTLIELISTPLMEALVPHITPETILDLAVSSQHTRRILQSIFERHKSDALTPIVTTIAQSSRRLAVSQQGCIAVIRTIENAVPHQKQAIISMLLPVLPALTMNCYGNYVVQCLLQHMDHASVVSVVCHSFAGHWVALSRNKFASNVMEKVVWQLDGAARRALVEELVLDTANLKCLMQDAFGNFVLQAIIDSSNDAGEFRDISSRVRQLLHTSPYGHKIENRLQSGLVRSLRMAPDLQGNGAAAPLANA